jgi:aspartate dehydrogenase
MGAGRRVGIIGLGAIGEVVARALLDEAGGSGPRLVAVLVRPGRTEKARRLVGAEVAVVHDVAGLRAARVEVVAECAGQGAVRDYGRDVLAAGADLMLVGTGALAEDGLREALLETARAHGRRIHVPAGATAGIDGLAALRIGGLERVRYTSTKPPLAWKGTPAEALVDLDRLQEPTAFFEGTAREAALAYPQNANLAATVALAGLGLERTTVRLVADPGASVNTGRIEALGATGRITVEVEGRPTPGNPKTSATTALSVLRALRNLESTLVI